MSRDQQPEDNHYHNNALETSILFQPHSIWALLFLLLVGIWFKFVSLIVVSAFLLFLFIIITAWKNYSLKHVKPDLQISRSRLFVDEEFEINASVYNDKWLPLIWLEWSFPKNTGISLDNNERGDYTIRFLWLLWFREVKWKLSGKALQRGVYDIGHVTLRSGDGFRFAETEQGYALDRKLYAYPKLMSVQVPDFRPSMQWSAKGKQGGYIEDPLMVIGIREYQAGDELRRFNWKASARTGKLLTNVYQPIVVEQLVVYIDVKGYVIQEAAFEDPIKQREYVIEKREAFEWFLSVIASVVVKYKGQGISMGFTSNGLNCYEEKMPNILPSRDLTPFLDQLAQITQRMGVRNMLPLDEMRHQGQLVMPVFIFCHHVNQEHYMWYQHHKSKLSQVSFYYEEETEYSKKLTAIAKPMTSFLSTLSIQ